MKTAHVLSLICLLFISVTADIFDINRSLGKGINLGNVLEAPSLGSWGEDYDTNYIRIIAEKGFQTVRIPIRWSPESRTAAQPPYTIDEEFFTLVDDAVDCALGHQLKTIINVHHYDALFESPEEEWDRFKAMWEQISARYKDYADDLVFEILNEPNTNLTPEKWNDLLAQTFPIIRESNPTRPVIIGIAEWGGIDALNKLVLPDDPNIILTVHYYLPFNFTHQEASWVDGSEAWADLTWEGSYHEKKAVIDDMEYIRSYSVEHAIPVFIGEFGVIEHADVQSRARWGEYCARLFEKYDFSWAWWAMGAGFAAYDKRNNQWIDAVADALLSTDTTILDMGEEVTGTDILKNGNFEDTTHWELGVWDSSAEAAATVANGEYTVQISTPSPDNWGIQLLQTGIHLEKDHSYVLSFDIRADSERIISAAVDQYIDTTYTEYASKWDLAIDQELKTVTVPFSVSSEDTDARLTFYFGVDQPTIYLSNVKIYDQGLQTSIERLPRSRLAKPYSFTSLMRGNALTLSFERNPAQPISILLCNTRGQILYKENDIRIDDTNRWTIPFQNRAAAPVIVQVKAGAKTESRTIFSY